MEIEIQYNWYVLITFHLTFWMTFVHKLKFFKKYQFKVFSVNGLLKNIDSLIQLKNLTNVAV